MQNNDPESTNQSSPSDEQATEEKAPEKVVEYPPDPRLIYERTRGDVNADAELTHLRRSGIDPPVVHRC